jgi:hypothetical protein
MSSLTLVPEQTKTDVTRLVAEFDPFGANARNKAHAQRQRQQQQQRQRQRSFSTSFTHSISAQNQHPLTISTNNVRNRSSSSNELLQFQPSFNSPSPYSSDTIRTSPISLSTNESFFRDTGCSFDDDHSFDTAIFSNNNNDNNDNNDNDNDNNNNNNNNSNDNNMFDDDDCFNQIENDLFFQKDDSTIRKMKKKKRKKKKVKNTNSAPSAVSTNEAKRTSPITSPTNKKTHLHSTRCGAVLLRVTSKKILQKWSNRLFRLTSTSLLLYKQRDKDDRMMSFKELSWKTPNETIDILPPNTINIGALYQDELTNRYGNKIWTLKIVINKKKIYKIGSMNKDVCLSIRDELQRTIHHYNTNNDNNGGMDSDDKIMNVFSPTRKGSQKKLNRKSGNQNDGSSSMYNDTKLMSISMKKNQRV